MSGDPSPLRIGTCSWNYEYWPLYSKKQKRSADYLPEYSEHFCTAEIDSWFYRTPDAKGVGEYFDKTPEDFVFSAKVPALFTRPVLADTPNASFLNPQDYNNFVRIVSGLREKLGILIFQFEYMNLQKMAGLDFYLSAWSRFLAHADRSIPMAVETRNGNYLLPKYFSFLLENGLFPVFSQKIYMPDICGIWPKVSALGFKKAVIRLLGDDRQEIEKATGERWDSIVFEKPEKTEIVSMIRQMQDSGVEIFLNINNHYEGSSIITAEFFKREFSLG